MEQCECQKSCRVNDTSVLGDGSSWRQNCDICTCKVSLYSLPMPTFFKIKCIVRNTRTCFPKTNLPTRKTTFLIHKFGGNVGAEYTTLEIFYVFRFWNKFFIQVQKFYVFVCLLFCFRKVKSFASRFSAHKLRTARIPYQSQENAVLRASVS